MIIEKATQNTENICLESLYMIDFIWTISENKNRLKSSQEMIEQHEISQMQDKPKINHISKLLTERNRHVPFHK